MPDVRVSEIATATDKLRRLARDAAAGLVGSIVLIANIVSLAALIFSGPLAHGSSTVIWAMLIGSAIAGVWIAWKTSNEIDLVAAGRLVVDVATLAGPTLRVRSITTHTVIGEMGFFRRTPRSATVSSEGPAVLYTLSRAAFERMQRERPDLANAFDEFLLRTLADRLVLTERMVAALSR